MTDYTVGDTFDVKFTTRQFSTGAPFALSSGAVAAYPDNSTTQITAGITLTAGFDSVTGLNNIRLVATTGNGYAAGSTYYLVLTAGTVDSVSVVGEVVGAFTLGRSAAAVDLANGTDGLGAIKTQTAAIEADTQDIQGRLPASLVSGRIDASVGAMANNVLTASAINADAITAAKLASDVTTELQSGLATASALSTVSGKIDTIDDFVDTEVAAIKAVTDKLDTALESDGGVYRFTENALEQAPAGGGGGGPTASEIADAVWQEAIADHSGTSGSTAEQLAAAGAAGDPWATALPGSYGSGTAGKIVGDNLNATVTSRASQSSVDTIDGIVDAILVDTAEIGAAGAGLSAVPWNAAWDAEVQSEAADALTAYDPPTRAEATSDKNEILTAVGDVPTNAELATALAAADDAVLAAIAALNNLSAAQVATEISDALSVDTRAELAAPPAANAPLAAKLTWLAMLARNKIDQTASAQTLYADNESTPVAEAAVSDDGTTATRGEYAVP